MGHDKQEVIQIGGRYRGAWLLEQADYTLEMARKESKALAPFGITKETLTAAVDARKTVQAAQRNKDVSRAEAKNATHAQSEAFARAKQWLRRAILIGDMAFADEPDKADGFHAGPKIGASLPRLAEKINSVLELLRRNADRVARNGGTPAFVKEGETLYQTLVEADTKQENARGSLPGGTAEYSFNKGQLYLTLKQINRAGRAAYVDNPVSAARFNMTLLYRRAAPRKKAQAMPAK